MKTIALMLPLALALFISPARAGIVVTVPATTDIWLAGQPDGSTVSGFFGTDTAPGESPILVNVIAGHTLIFSATGSTSVDGGNFAASPDGGVYDDESPFGVGPANGISAIAVAANALIGVFLDDNVPTGPGSPAALDFTFANAGFSSLAPLLNQLFFIGDGLTGTGTGSVQTFLVPTGATRLFLAVSDSIGSSNASEGNLGSINADISEVPEPAQWPLVAAALSALACTPLRRRRA